MPASNPTARLLTLLLVAFAAACAPRPGERAADLGEPATQPVATQFDAADLQRTEGIAVGPRDAPVVIYEFADFQCPGCAQFAAVATPHIKRNYVEPGHVRYVHYDFPLLSIHPHAFLAARAARCAQEQERFWEYHDALYEQQRAWSRAEEVATLFADYAAEVGLDRPSFESCLHSDRHAEEVTRNLRLGESLGVPGTPTLFLNGRRIEVRSIEDLDRQIQEELSAASRTG